MKGYYLGLKIMKYIFIYLNCQVSMNIKCSNLLLIPYSAIFSSEEKMHEHSEMLNKHFFLKKGPNRTEKHNN